MQCVVLRYCVVKDLKRFTHVSIYSQLRLRFFCVLKGHLAVATILIWIDSKSESVADLDPNDYMLKMSLESILLWDISLTAQIDSTKKKLLEQISINQLALRAQVEDDSQLPPHRVLAQYQ